jgi:F0F1-type ATP synthase assembly protein I
VKGIIRSSPLLQMGWVVAFSVLIPLGAGLLLDRRFGTAPLFSLVGALLGIIASTVGAVRVASRAIDALGQAAKADGAGETAETDELADGKEDRA